MRSLLCQVVADRRGGDAAFAHCVADLVESVHHVARGVEARHACPLVVVDRDTSLALQFGADHFGKLGMRVGPQRRIDAVECMLALGRVDDDASLRSRRLAPARRLTAIPPLPASRDRPRSVAAPCPGRSASRPRCSCGGTAPRRRRGSADADHADLLVGHLITVADRAVADEASRQCVVVKVLVHWRACDWSSRSRAELSAPLSSTRPIRRELPVVVGAKASSRARSRSARHICTPARAFGQAVRCPRCRPGNRHDCECRGSTKRGSSLRQRQRFEMKSRQIDGGRQAGGAAADHEAVERCVHARSSPRRGASSA